MEPHVPYVAAEPAGTSHATVDILLVGAGSRRRLTIHPPGRRGGEIALTTLDIEPRHNPDVVHDLDVRPLPFDDNSFDEIHAYEVLEHVGRQGDWRAFFAEFMEYWRILRAGGYLCYTVPYWRSVWAWGDPGHTRCLPLETVVFLDRDQYEQQVGRTPMSDYRSVWHGDFRLMWHKLEGETQMVALEARKP